MNKLLIDVIPARARAYVYAVIALLALVYGCWEAAGGNWAQFAGALVVTLTGLVANANTPTDE